MQGTGVWSFIKADRADKATKPPASKAAKTVGAWWKEELCARGAGQGCQKVAAE